LDLKLFALTCGYLSGDLGYLMEGGEGKAELPIPAYLIEHPKGTALFDTGMHPDCQRDPAARVGQRIADLFSFHFRPGEEIGARLEAIGRDPARIDIIVNSHFHFDHVGGNALIPNAIMAVQRREWEAGRTPHRRAARLQPLRFRSRPQGHPDRGRARPVWRWQRHLPADLRSHARPSVARRAARIG
jgi:glyoxylase-like metal-dependent hydrolase (beta-lactamase superfamily II)